MAATILQLVADGRVDLDAPVETYLPGRIRGAGIDANAITVRQLLRHQSGLPEYFDADTPPPTEPVTADQLLDMALRRPAQFTPGSAMKYTNTNYVVAGLLIESVTGRPAAGEITWRIIVPLGLFDTYFPALGDTGLRAPFAHGYEVIDGQRKDVTAFNASAAGMSGCADLHQRGHVHIHHRAARRPGRTACAAGSDDEHRLSAGDRLPLRAGAGKHRSAVRYHGWGHGGDIEGYHSLMAKPIDGPALSATFSQSPESKSLTDDPGRR